MELRIYVLNYNYGHYLKECIQSLLDQSDSCFSVTCVDNGSVDGSREYLRDVALKQRWEFLEFDNIPVSHVGNRVCQNSDETYVTRLDADDKLMPDFVEKVRSVFARDNPDIVYGNYYLVDFDGVIFSTQHILPRGITEGGSIHSEPFHGACTIFRREKMLDYGGYYEEFSRNDGFDLYLKFRLDHMIHIKEPIFQYRRGHRSLSENKSRLFRTRAEIIERYCDDIGIEEDKKTLHVLAFPNQPGFYTEKNVNDYNKFIEEWGYPTKTIVRDRCFHSSSSTLWSEIDGRLGLRGYLETDPGLAAIERFVVHSMNDKLAPILFFEIAPKVMSLFESTGVITGIKYESSMYKVVSGGAKKIGSSRVLYDDECMVLHAGGLTAFCRHSLHDEVNTLLELSSDMLMDGHV